MFRYEILFIKLGVVTICSFFKNMNALTFNMKQRVKQHKNCFQAHKKMGGAIYESINYATSQV